jgi:NADPH:quinone reductase
MKKMEPSGIVRIERPGPPEVLTYPKTTLQQPAHGEVFIHQKAIGVNFADVFFRNGTFPIDAYPAPIGFEAAGVIEHLGAGVDNFAVGDRVAYHSSLGSYAEGRVLPAKDLFKLPDDVSFDQAAALMIKGLTAHMLLKESHEVKTGEVVLIHAMTGAATAHADLESRKTTGSIILRP